MQRDEYAWHREELERHREKLNQQQQQGETKPEVPADEWELEPMI